MKEQKEQEREKEKSAKFGIWHLGAWKSCKKLNKGEGVGAGVICARRSCPVIGKV